MSTRRKRASQLVAAFLVVILTGTARANRPSNEDPDEAVIRELATAILARTDAVDELEEIVEERQETSLRLAKDIAAAQELVETRKAAQKQYLEAISVRTRQIVLSELAAAEAKEKKARKTREWSEQAVRDKILTEQLSLAYSFGHQATVDALTKARKKQFDFEEDLFPKEKKRFQAEVTSAETDLAKKRDDSSRAKARLARAAKKLETTALSPVEEEALSDLDQTIQLRSRRQWTKAKEKLDAARQLWSTEAKRRAEKTSIELDDRITGAARQVRQPPLLRQAGKEL